MKPKIAERMPLTTRMDIRLPPWAEVLPSVCDRMRMSDVELSVVERRYLPPKPLDLAYLKTRFGTPLSALTEVDLEHLESDLLPLRIDAEVLLAEYRQAIDSGLSERCATGRYDRQPISNIENAHMPSDRVYAISFAVSGWVISCGVGPSDVPQLVDVTARLAELGEKHAVVIRDFLKARK